MYCEDCDPRVGCDCGKEDAGYLATASSITLKDLQRAKEALIKADLPLHYIPLAPLQECMPNQPKLCSIKQNLQKEYPSAFKPKENKMQNMHLEVEVAAVSQSPAQTEADTQRRFLVGKLEDAYYASKDALRKTFNLDDMDQPKTPKELAARLAAGLFVIRHLDKQPDYAFNYHDAGEYIQWRDPSKPADQAGFDAAKALLKAACDDAELTIRIQSPADGLTALKAFKATSVQ
jgi:hypothetical protein